jgi:hypothetical protein
MSLSNLLDYNNKNGEELRTALANLFPLPKQKFNQIIRAEPLTKNYALVGTAFDYLLRFSLEKNYKEIYSSRWVAELAVEKLNDRILAIRGKADEQIFMEDLEPLHKKKKKINKNIRSRFKSVKKTIKKYVNSSNSVDNDLLKGCLFLGKLDFLYRRGEWDFFEIDFENEDDKDVMDLNNLINICDISLFKPENRIYLNPSFGEGSTLVNGADADLAIDDLLIDIKVTKEIKVTRQYYNQIICYYLLFMIGGINGNREHKIKRLGIYFARHGYLWTIHKWDIGFIDKFNTVIDILKKIKDKKPNAAKILKK